MTATIVWADVDETEFPNSGLCAFGCTDAQTCRRSSLEGEGGLG